MIGKAASISHGINDIRYITGESRHKEPPELIYHIKDNLLPCGLDAQGIWDLMKAGAPMKKNVIRMEISPGDGTYRKLYHEGLAEAVGRLCKRVRQD